MIDDQTIEYYNQEVGDYICRTRSVDLSALYKRFLMKVDAEGRILDVGAGSGRDLKAFRERGFDPVGIEPSVELAREARAFSGCACYVRDILSIDWTDHFNGVWACASLVHVNESLFVPSVEKLTRSLKRGGALYMSLIEGSGARRLGDGRFFQYHSLEGLVTLLRLVPQIEVVDTWRTDGASADKPDLTWLNVVALRT